MTSAIRRSRSRASKAGASSGAPCALKWIRRCRTAICTAVKLKPTPSAYALDHTLPKVALFVPKRLLTIVVPDDVVTTVVKAIIKVNQTGKAGDGKIFVSPIEGAVRVSDRREERRSDSVTPEVQNAGVQSPGMHDIQVYRVHPLNSVPLNPVVGGTMSPITGPPGAASPGHRNLSMRSRSTSASAAAAATRSAVSMCSN